MLCNSFVVGSVPIAAGAKGTSGKQEEEEEERGEVDREEQVDSTSSFYKAWKQEYSAALARAATATERDDSAAGSGTQSGSGSGRAGGSGSKRLGSGASSMVINNVNSLACLATPIRSPRVLANNQNSTRTLLQTTPPPPLQGAKLVQENLTSATSFQPSQDNYNEPMMQRMQAKNAPCPSANNFRQINQQTLNNSVAGEQIYCPVWAFVMARLDARQRQPRDQSRWSHLIGSPSAKGYLFAPEEPLPAGGEPLPVAERSPSRSEQSLNCPRVFVSSGPSSTAENSYNQTGSDDELASSVNSETELEGEELELSASFGTGDSRLKMTVSSQSASKQVAGRQPRRSSNESMEKGKAGGSLSGGDQRHLSAKEASGGQLSDNNNNNNTKQQQLGLDSTDSSSRMKRFSSAQCLSNEQQIRQLQQQLLDSAGSNLEPEECREMSSRGRKEERSQFKKRTSREKKSAAKQQAKEERRNEQTATSGFLSPDDPMILARQRRPSVSNQGSLNVDQQALFSAVECNQLERARAILEEGKVKINSLNGDKLTCLDIAVLLRNVEMVSLLQQYNAKEGSAYLTREGRENQLYALYTEARRLVEDLSRSLSAISPNAAAGSVAGSNPPPASGGPQSDYGFLSGQMNSSGQLMLATGSLLSSALLEEKQRQLQYWRRRLDLFTQMRYQFERLQIPSAPELIVLQVTGENSLGVKIVHSLRSNSIALNQPLEPEAAISEFNPDNCQQDEQQKCESVQAKPEVEWRLQSAARSLNSINAADLESLPACFQGRKCTHWHLLAASNLNLTSTNYIQSIQEKKESKFTRKSFVSSCRDEEKLAVFNQLLEQQLNLLRNQQRSHQLNKLQQLEVCRLQNQNQNNDQTNQNNRFAASGKRSSKMIMLLSQNASTDSACETLTSSSCKSTSGGGKRPGSGVKGQEGDFPDSPLEQSCQSITYKLMTSQPPAPLPGMMAAQLLNPPKAPAIAVCGGVSGVGGGGGREKGGRVIITKYKIEWSLNEQMDPILNSMIVYNTNNYPLECQIGRLSNGQSYFVRVSSGNHRGFSEPRPSSPISLSPSSWRQVDGNKRRKYDGEVYRKFTKLILLNKHVLDEHHQNALQLLSTSTSNPMDEASLSSVPFGTSYPIQATNPAGKSSLINMLLLDATTPVEQRQSYRLPDGSLINTSREPEATTFGGGAELLPGEQLQKQELGSGSTSMRKNLRNFFQSNSFKFHKLTNQNKKGLYLATVIYYTRTTSNNIQINESTSAATSAGNCDKIVVTNDDRLPIIEIVNEPISPGALMSDFYWLLKINGTQWIDIKRLRQQLQKCHSSSTLHIRIKLLNAIEQMQLALNLEDIGRLFYKPIQAHDGSMIICTCRRVFTLKAVSNLSIKWTNQSKIIPKHLRKISDTIGNNQGTSGSTPARRRADSSRDSTSSATILPATTIGPPPTLQSASSSLTSNNNSNVSVQMELGNNLQELGNYCATGSNSANKLRHHSEYKLCEFCQQALQRRPTMASGSSSSSLTSSNDSQWSLQQREGPTSGASKCTCNRSVQAASFLGSGQQPGTGSGIQQQRNSSTSPASRSGSMISTAQLGHHQHHPSTSSAGNSRNSQNQLNAAQKSSTYLLLASLTLYDLLLFTLNEIIHFDGASTIPIKRGLYLGFVQLQTTVESMRLLVPRNRPNMVPCARVRDNSHVSKEEWQLVKKFATFNQQPQQQQLQMATLNSASSSNNSLTSGAASQQSVLAAGQQQQSSSRCSEPSIWSLERLADDKPEVDLNSANNPTTTTGFDRTRAKSVSPGLTKQQIQQEQEQQQPLRSCEPEVAGGLSISTSQLSGQNSSGSCSSAATSGNLEASSGSQQAHSDSDLTTARNLISQTTAGQLVTRETTSNINYDTRASNAAAEHRKLRGEGAREAPSAGGRQSFASHFRSPRSLEVETLSSSSNRANLLAQSPEETFVRLIGSAGRRLLAELKSQLPKVYDESKDEMVSILQSLNDDENNRIYHLELIELNSQVTFILLIPAAENVCPVTSHEKSNILGDNKDYMLLPLQIFETIHISTYEPDLLGKYSRLSAFLETDLILAQHDHRQAFSSSELKITKSRVNQLQDMVSVADEFWRQLRWIVDVVSFARDKSVSIANNGIKLGSIWRHFEPPASSNQYQTNSMLHQSRESLEQSRAAATSGGAANRPRQLPLTRTSSARNNNDQASSQTLESLPQIHLSKLSSFGENEWTSGGATADTPTNPPKGTTCCEEEEEEEAIYSYLISLKDQANHRKSSQQSTRPVLDLDLESSIKSGLTSPQVSNCNFKLISPQTPPTAAASQKSPPQGEFNYEVVEGAEKSDDFCLQVKGCDPNNVVYVPREWTFQQVSRKPEAEVEKQQRQLRQKRDALKATNPFLSDSFEGS